MYECQQDWMERHVLYPSWVVSWVLLDLETVAFHAASTTVHSACDAGSHISPSPAACKCNIA